MYFLLRGLRFTPFLRNLSDITEQVRLSIVGGLSLHIGGDSGVAVPYELSSVLVARRLRCWLSLLEGDVNSDSAG